jgi:hypothetical protein
VNEPFGRTDDVDDGLRAAAFVGPPSADPVQVVVADADAGRLLDFEIPPPGIP